MEERKPWWNRAAGAALIVLRAGVLLFALFFAVTAVLWKSWPLVIWFAFIGAVGVWPWRRSRNWRVGGGVAGCVLVLYTGFFVLVRWDIPFDQLQNRMEELHNKSLAPDSSRTLDTTDRLTIWTGNIAMGVVGFPLFPEVAWETLRMIAPGPKEHIIRSGFAMRSRKVRDVLADFARSLPDRGPPQTMKTAKIGWGVDYAHVGYHEARVGLAVNCPFVLDAKAIREKDSWTIEARGSCDVAYPRFPEMTPTFTYRGKSFRISETMFWALQQVGWLHPFRATYVWMFDANDRRLFANG